MAQPSYDPKTQMYDDGRGGRYFGAQYAGMAPPPQAPAQQPPAANPVAAAQQPPPAMPVPGNRVIGRGASMPPPVIPTQQDNAVSTPDVMPPVPPPTGTAPMLSRGGSVPGPVDQPDQALTGIEQQALGGGNQQGYQNQADVQGQARTIQQGGSPQQAAGGPSSYLTAAAPAFGPDSNALSAARNGSNLPGSQPPVTPGIGVGTAGAMGGSYGQQPGQRRYNPQNQGAWGATSQANGPTSTGPDHNSGSGFAPPENKGQQTASQNPASSTMGRYKAPATPRTPSTGSSQGGPQGL